MPETCTAEQADFRNAWQQNGTAKMAAFLSPDELGELRTAVDASYELLRLHADDDPPTLTEFLADHYKRWDGIWVPHAMPGDAILFDHWTLHHTQRMEQDNAVRTSRKFRFVRTS
jgi:hypothetical protein